MGDTHPGDTQMIMGESMGSRQELGSYTGSQDPKIHMWISPKHVTSA
jgi:hypothetical protein